MTSHGLRASVLCGAMMLTACDRVFNLSRVPDAPEAPDAQVDAAPDGPEELGFSMIQPVPVVNSSSSDGDPTLTSDMTEIYFKSTRSGGLGLDDIWYSTRAMASDAWSAPMRSKLSTAEYENQPRIAPDGLTIWFRRGGGTSARLMVSTRASAKDDSLWSTPMVLTELDATSSAEDAALMSSLPTQVVGYLMSRRNAGSELRIYRTTRASNTVAWGTPSELTELVGGGTYDQSPWVTPDQLTITFDSDRTGCVAGGDIWLATRASAGDDFGEPICLREVNSLSYESSPWISPDLRHIFYRSSASGGGDIWEAHR